MWKKVNFDDLGKYKNKYICIVDKKAKTTLIGKFFIDQNGGYHIYVSNAFKLIAFPPLSVKRHIYINDVKEEFKLENIDKGTETEAKVA